MELWNEVARRLGQSAPPGQLARRHCIKGAETASRPVLADRQGDQRRQDAVRIAGVLERRANLGPGELRARRARTTRPCFRNVESAAGAQIACCGQVSLTAQIRNFGESQISKILISARPISKFPISEIRSSDQSISSTTRSRSRRSSEIASAFWERSRVRYWSILFGLVGLACVGVFRLCSVQPRMVATRPVPIRRLSALPSSRLRTVGKEIDALFVIILWITGVVFIG